MTAPAPNRLANEPSARTRRSRSSGMPRRVNGACACGNDMCPPRSLSTSRLCGETCPGRIEGLPTLDGVLTIAQEIFDAIVAHTKRDHPDEACGVVAGPEGSDRPERFVPMVNAAGSPTFYEFDSTELLHLYKDMDARDEEPVLIYHSHTATEAYPSRTDIGLASEPNAHYVLVSTREHGNSDGPVAFRSYRIIDGVVTEEEVATTPPQQTQEESTPSWPSRSGSPPSCAPTPTA